MGYKYPYTRKIFTSTLNIHMISYICLVRRSGIPIWGTTIDRDGSLSIGDPHLECWVVMGHQCWILPSIRDVRMGGGRLSGMSRMERSRALSSSEEQGLMAKGGVAGF